jgi:transposase-like protein
MEDGILKKDVLGRVRTPRERRAALLAEFDQSGMSGQKFAAWAGIKYPTWASWVQKRRQEAGQTPLPKAKPKRTNPVRWLEAVVTNPTPVQESARSKTAGIIVHGPGGVRIEITEARQVSLAVQLLREWKRGC